MPDKVRRGTPSRSSWRERAPAPAWPGRWSSRSTWRVRARTWHHSRPPVQRGGIPQGALSRSTWRVRAPAHPRLTCGLGHFVLLQRGQLQLRHSCGPPVELAPRRPPRWARAYQWAGKGRASLQRGRHLPRWTRSSCLRTSRRGPPGAEFPCHAGHWTCSSSIRLPPQVWWTTGPRASCRHTQTPCRQRLPQPRQRQRTVRTTRACLRQVGLPSSRRPNADVGGRALLSGCALSIIPGHPWKTQCRRRRCRGNQWRPVPRLALRGHQPWEPPQMTEAMATSRSRPHRRPCLSMRVTGSPAWRLPSLKPLRPRRLLACIGAPRLGHSPAAEVRPEEPPAIWPPQERSPFPGRSASPVPTMFTIGWEQHREWQGSALYWVDIMSGAAQWEQPRMVPAAILTPAWSQCRRVGNPRTWYTQTRARLGRPALATWRRPALRPATPLREIAVRASQGSPSPYPAHNCGHGGVGRRCSPAYPGSGAALPEVEHPLALPDAPRAEAAVAAGTRTHPAGAPPYRSQAALARHPGGVVPARASPPPGLGGLPASQPHAGQQPRAVG